MAEIGRYSMNRRQIIFVIILTAVVAVFLSALIITTIKDVNSQVEQKSFEKLADTSKLLASEIKRALRLTEQSSLLWQLLYPAWRIRAMKSCAGY